MNYCHLTQEERYQIYAYKQTGKLPTEIADILDRSKSTIYRELARNTGARGCRPMILKLPLINQHPLLRRLA